MAAVLLDASVIIPAALADTLLRAAAIRLYDVVWSDDILAEVQRNLVEDGFTTEEGARRRVDAMREAFPGATVHGYRDRIDAMTNHPKDRHVLAAAVVAGVANIVTSNQRHFPPHALAQHRIEALSPDEFLLRLDDLDHAAMTVILRSQAADLRRPPMTVRDIITNLTVHAPRFSARFAAEPHVSETWTGGRQETPVPGIHHNERITPMCGRYVLKAPEDISERFQLRQFTLHLEPTYNAAPSMELPVIVENEGGEWEAKLMRWGLIPRWAKPGDKTVAPINARAETLLEKPMFRSLVSRKRCIVPASGFYEWKQQQGRKQPYFVSLPDDPTFGLAGLYDEFADKDGELIASYTIVTTTPNELMATLHNRMPVILPRTDEEEWLSREVTDQHQVERLLVPYPADAMTAWPVSPAVNNVRNDTPHLIEPIGETMTEADLADGSDAEDEEQGRLFD